MFCACLAQVASSLAIGVLSSLMFCCPYTNVTHHYDCCHCCVNLVQATLSKMARGVLLKFDVLSSLLFEFGTISIASLLDWHCCLFFVIDIIDIVHCCTIDTICLLLNINTLVSWHAVGLIIFLVGLFVCHIFYVLLDLLSIGLMSSCVCCSSA